MNSTTNSHHNVPKTQIHLEVIYHGGYQCIEQVVITKQKEKQTIIK